MKSIKRLTVIVGFGLIVAILGRFIGNVMSDDPIPGLIIFIVAAIVLGGLVQIILSVRRP